MQLHMFWALYIHAADAQEVRATRTSRRRSGTTCATCAQLFWEWPWHKGELALRHVPALDADARGLRDARRLRRVVGAKENDFTRFWHDHADIPATMTTGWYDGFPHSDTEYFAAMAAKNTRRSG